MKVILSIKPQFVEKLFSGEKLYEYRRKIFKMNVESVVIYSSSPVKALVGEFIVDDIISLELNLLWELTKDYSGIDKQYFFEYFRNVEKGYAIKVNKITQYEKAIKLSDYGVLYPPQSYVYV